MRYLTLAVALLLALAHANGFAEQNRTLIQNGGSESVPGSSFASRKMVRAILSSYDEEDRVMFTEMLNECVADKKTSQEKFFLKKRLPPMEKENVIYFVRPSIKPYCGAFYGAHIFQFWLVSQNDKVLYSGGADGVTIFKTSHNGMYDLEIEHGGGWGISQTQLEFDGHEYKPSICTETRLDEKGKEKTSRVNCSREL